MYKYFLLVAVALSFVSCSLPQTQSIKPNEKAFAQEDLFILYSLRLEEIRDNKSASDLYNMLYDRSGKKEYLYRSLENDLIARDNEKLISRVDAISKGTLDDAKLTRLKVVALFELNRLDEAKTLSLKLVEKTQEVNDYLLASDILIKRQEYDVALKYLESAYVKEYNEQILGKMSIILYVNLGRKKDAIAQLETHTYLHGCSELICKRLIGFYSNDNNLEGLLSAYKRLYKINSSEKIAKNIIQIYTYKKEYSNLVLFLEDSKVDDELLLELYVATKFYKKAYLLADKLYASSSNVVFVGQSAIYEYMNAKNKSDKKVLSSVIEKLEKASSLDNGTIYLNYLGYILIDHDVDVKQGIKYIKEVLEVEPNSSYYLDSLAWGYYKLGEYEKAKSIMNKVVTLEGGDDEEVLLHIKKIDASLKNKKGNK